MSADYRHTQIGTFNLAAFAVAISANAWVGFLTGWHAVYVVALVLLLACGVLLTTLTVEIRDGVLDCRFGPGLIRKRFTLGDIQAARAVRNRWYYGWGIRWTPHGWLFNVSGLDVVELPWPSVSPSGSALTSRKSSRRPSDGRVVDPSSSETSAPPADSPEISRGFWRRRRISGRSLRTVRQRPPILRRSPAGSGADGEFLGDLAGELGGIVKSLGDSSAELVAP